jgi:ATP-binding cassette subfamily B protein
VIERLPQGYDTLLGKWFANGVELSGGEQQRIALARAYLRQAPIILLDEPTSFIDSWAEAEWFERFRALAAGRTGIIITHRFTIAMRADSICVMEGGRIVEAGVPRGTGETRRVVRPVVGCANDSEFHRR